MRRLLRDFVLPATLLALPAVPVLAGCAGREVTARGVELIDPQGLIDDILGSGHPLRLYVLPSDAYGCDPATGEVSPDPEDLEPGLLEAAVVDISVDATGRAEVVVPVGTWTVFVRGKGTDTVTGVRDTLIGRGCSTATVANGETLEVAVQLIPIVGMGICSDTVLSPDEQCFPAGTATCNAVCETLPQPVNTFVVAGDQNHARLATAEGMRIAVTFDHDRMDVALRMLEANGTPVAAGAASRDEALTDIGMGLPSVQLGGVPAMADDGRFAIALVDYAPAQSDVYAFFYSADRNVMGRANLRTDASGTQAAPSPAFDGSGALLVAFEDSQSPTGLSARAFARGAMTGTGPEAVAIGIGATGGSAPSLAGLASGFVAVFEAGTDVRFQRLDATGGAVDASARAVDDAPGTRETPVVAALADGSFLVAWTEQIGSPTVRARAFDTSGAPMGPAVTVPTTSGATSAPSITAGAGNYLVAWQAGAGVRARVLSRDAAGLLNRERPPTTADFSVATAGAAPSVAAIGSTGALGWLVAYDAGGDIFSRFYPR